MRNYSRKFRKYRGGGLFGPSDPSKELEEAKTEAKKANDKVTELETAMIQAPAATATDAVSGTADKAKEALSGTADKAKEALSGTADKAKEAFSGFTSMFSSKPAPPPQTGAGRRRRNRSRRTRKSKSRR